MKRNIATIEAPIPRDFWAELKREKLIVEEAPVPSSDMLTMTDS